MGHQIKESGMELIGWLGGVLLSICGLPQAVKSFQDKHSNGLSWNFLLMWFFGEILLLIYTIPTGMLPLIVNYVFNLVLVSVILYYKIEGTKYAVIRSSDLRTSNK